MSATSPDLPKRRDFLKLAGAMTGALFGRPLDHGVSRAAQAADIRPMRDVVVLLPGLMGSVLSRNGRDVWALSGGAIVNGISSMGRSITDLMLTSDAGGDLGDGVTAPRILSDAHLIPGLWKIDGYSEISQYIARTFDVVQGQNFFTFPYDWRRDNRVAAKQLARAGDKWLKAWREKSGNRAAKLILVAHSMGGLVARYYLECLEGWRSTRQLVTFGTPYSGSLNALGFLSNGFKKAVGPLTLADFSDLLRSFTSIYQLLPTYDCYDPGDGKTVTPARASRIPNVSSDRACNALAFHDEITRAVNAHMKDNAYLEGRYSIHPIVGTDQATDHFARLVDNRLQMLRKHPDGVSDGDGTVPMRSAKPEELKQGETYLPEMHGSLQNARSVLTHVKGVLTNTQSNITRRLRGDRRAVTLAIDDVYATTEDVEIQAYCPPDEGPVKLNAVVTKLGAQRDGRARELMMRTDGIHVGEIGRLEEGTYRLAVGGPDVSPVHDLFVVVRT